MAKSNRNKAKRMASRGASVKEIRKETGVKREAAQKFTQKATQVTQAAKQAAATGTYNKSNTRDLRQAGASKSRIQNIKGVNRDLKAAAAGAAEARENPTYQGAGFQDALQNQVAGGGTVGQSFYDSLDAGVRGDLTSEEVAKYAMSQGYGLGDQWQKDFGTKTEDAQTLKEAMKGDNKTRLSALLKIAAGQGKGTDFVDNKEFNKIFKYYDGGKSGLKINDRIDKINAKQAAKDNGYNPIGLQRGILEKISKNKYGDRRDIAWNNMTNLAFGKEGPMRDAFTKLDGRPGPLSQLALNYKGSNIEGMKGNQGVYGADANGNAIFSPGQGGKSWSQNRLNKSTELSYTPWATNVQPVGGDDGGGGGGGTGGTGGPTTDGPVVPETEVDNSASSGAGGLDIASWAPSYKMARSARQKLGNSAQGLASQKKNPFIPWAK
jgi:hypothetical protein